MMHNKGMKIILVCSVVFCAVANATLSNAVLSNAVNAQRKENTSNANKSPSISSNAVKPKNLDDDSTRPSHVKLDNNWGNPVVVHDHKEPNGHDTSTPHNPPKPNTKPTDSNEVHIGLEFRPVSSNPTVTNGHAPTTTGNGHLIHDHKEPAVVGGNPTTNPANTNGAIHHPTDNKDPLPTTNDNNSATTPHTTPTPTPITNNNNANNMEDVKEKNGEPSNKSIKLHQHAKVNMQCTFPYNPYLDPFFAGTWIGEDCRRRRRCDRRRRCVSSSERRCDGRDRDRDACGRPIPGRSSNNLSRRRREDSESFDNVGRSNANFKDARKDARDMTPIEKPLLPLKRMNQNRSIGTPSLMDEYSPDSDKDEFDLA